MRSLIRPNGFALQLVPTPQLITSESPTSSETLLRTQKGTFTNVQAGHSLTRKNLTRKELKDNWRAETDRKTLAACVLLIKDYTSKTNTELSLSQKL